MGIQWELIGAPVDIGGKFKAGFEHGQMLRKQQQQEHALSAFVRDPGNVDAQNALADASPEFAMSLAGNRMGQATDQAKRDTIRGYIGPDADFAGGARRAAQAGDLDAYEALMKLDKPQRDKVGGMYKGAAPIAYKLRQMTDPAERAAFFADARPILQSQGWTDDVLNGFDVNDNGALDAVIASAQTVDQLIDQGKITWHQQGEQPSFATDAMGKPVGSDNPYAGGSPPILTDDDIIKMDGGQTAPPSGGFPR